MDSPDEIVMVLDGMVHLIGGYQLALWKSGAFTEVHATDFSRPQLSRQGKYTLKGDQLCLRYSLGGLENLYRVSFKGLDYWVHSDDRGKLADDYLRARTFKTFPIERAQRYVTWKLHNSPEPK